MKRAGSFGFVAATVILVLIAAFSFAGTVMSRTSCSNAELEGYYRELVYPVRSNLSTFRYDDL